MSPRGSSSITSSGGAARSSVAPYSRRPTSQPKSSRQQFSACGACRMRRVRCDLKDLPMTAGPHPACSNCKERGIKCVDEFADVKAVKLLRRGRRLQQVEAIYGKVVPSDGGAPPSTASSSSSRRPITIPNLKPEFFSSAFWRWFNVHRPVLDPVEFPARFLAHSKGNQPLKNEGWLLSALLVVWAASFGLDERGAPEPDSANSSNSGDSASDSDTIKREDVNNSESKAPKELYAEKRKVRKERTESMLREVLELVDFYGIMRKPTIDGVCVLLLVLPLLEDSQPLERLAVYETALLQVQSLCTSAQASSSSLQSNDVDDSMVRARIYCYAHSQEGILTGMKGGRFVLDNDDLDAFHRTLPPMLLDLGSSGITTPPSPISLDAPHAVPTQQLLSSQPYLRNSSGPSYRFANVFLTLPLRLSAVCRKVHAVLTGMKATRRAEDHGLIDARGMREIWHDLDHFWTEFDALNLDSVEEDPIKRLITEHFIAGWQIFIFECHNVIRESLKQYMSSTPTQAMYSNSPSSRPSSHSATSSPYLPPHHLHTVSTRKCLALLPRVVNIMKRNLSSTNPMDGRGLFQWDNGLVRDGLFFAGYLAASSEKDIIQPSEDRQYRQDEPDNSSNPLTTEDAVSVYLSAIANMRWAFSKSEEREETVRMVWQSRKVSRQNLYDHSSTNFQAEYRQPNLDPNVSAFDAKTAHQMHLRTASHPVQVTSMQYDRPHLPPLNLFVQPSRRPESAPHLSCNEGQGVNAWSSYTPPGTSSTASTGLSVRGSPVFHGMGSYKTDPTDGFYGSAGDLDQFSFNVPMSNTLTRDGPTLANNIPTYVNRTSLLESQALRANTPSHYLGGSTIYAAPASSVMGGNSGNDFNSCPQFGDSCNGVYH